MKVPESYLEQLYTSIIKYLSLHGIIATTSFGNEINQLIWIIQYALPDEAEGVDITAKNICLHRMFQCFSQDCDDLKLLRIQIQPKGTDHAKWLIFSVYREFKDGTGFE